MSEQDDLKAKIKEYQAAIAQDRKSLVFVPLTACYLKTGLLDDALETALRGTWELPDYAPGFVAVGKVYATRGSEAKTVAAFNKAMEVDPSCLDAYKGLARYYHEQGNDEAASHLLTKAIFLFPDEPTLKKMLESLTPAEQPAPAPAPAPPAVESPVEEEKGLKPITTATIAEIYIEQGLYDKALDVYRELLAETQDPAVAQKIAEIEMLAQGAGGAAGAEEQAATQPAVEVEPVVEVEPIVEAEPVAPAPASATANTAQASGAVLDILNGMLQSIQARRNRV